MSATRWATFDCYGTLIDWNGGIRGELERLFGPEEAPLLLERYHELEPGIEAGGYRRYRGGLTRGLEQLLRDEGLQPPEGETDALARSLPNWMPFPEVPEALAELRRRGWNIGVLVTTHRDLLLPSERQIGVPFDLAIVAEDVRSYKPAH